MNISPILEIAKRDGKYQLKIDRIADIPPDLKMF